MLLEVWPVEGFDPRYGGLVVSAPSEAVSYARAWSCAGLSLGIRDLDGAFSFVATTVDHAHGGGLMAGIVLDAIPPGRRIDSLLERIDAVNLRIEAGRRVDPSLRRSCRKNHAWIELTLPVSRGPSAAVLRPLCQSILELLGPWTPIHVVPRDTTTTEDDLRAASLTATDAGLYDVKAHGLSERIPLRCPSCGNVLSDTRHDGLDARAGRCRGCGGNVPGRYVGESAGWPVSAGEARHSWHEVRAV